MLIKKIDRLAALASRGKEGKREKGYLESSGLAQHSETDSVVAEAGAVAEAKRGTAMPRIVVPRTAAYHPTCTFIFCAPSAAVCRCALVAIVPMIKAPFQHVAM